MEADGQLSEEDETLEQLKARLAVPLLPMLVPVPPTGRGGPAKRRTTGFLKSNQVAQQALQTLSLPEIGRRSSRTRPVDADVQMELQMEMPKDPVELEALQRELRTDLAAALGVDVSQVGKVEAQTERPRPTGAKPPRELNRAAHTERAGMPPDGIVDLQARGFHLLAARLREEQEATEAAEGQEAELMMASLEDFFGHVKEFWSRESESQMVDHLAKRGPRRMAQKLSQQQQSMLAAQKRHNKMHQKRLTAVKSIVDVASPPQYQHHKVNHKKLQLQKEQRQELARLNRLSKRRVMESRNPAISSAANITPRPPKKPAEKPSSRLRSSSRRLSEPPEQQHEQGSPVEGEDAGMLGFEPEAKAWMKKMKRACSNGDLPLLYRALDHFDVNKSLSGGWLPLSLAASAGHAEVVRELLRHGADAKGPSVPSALELASSSGHAECVEALIRAHSTAQNASAACEKAALGGHLHVLGILLTYNSELLSDLTHSALQRVCDATEQHELKFGKVRPKLRVWYTSLRARLAAFDALEAATKAGDVEGLRLVLKGRRWLPAELDRCFASGWTALGSVAAAGQVEMLQMLLEAGAKPAAQMSDGCDAIFLASQTGMEQAEDLLILWQNKHESANKVRGGSRFKALAARGLNKQREKSALINQIRAGGADPDEVPWYKTPGGRPPRSEQNDPVRAAAEAVSINTRAMPDKKHHPRPPRRALKFVHGTTSALVSALSVQQTYEQELIQRGVDPSSSVAVYGSTDVRVHRDMQQQQQRQQQQEQEAVVPTKAGMRKWRIGDTVV